MINSYIEGLTHQAIHPVLSETLTTVNAFYRIQVFGKWEMNTPLRVWGCLGRSEPGMVSHSKRAFWCQWNPTKYWFAITFFNNESVWDLFYEKIWLIRHSNSWGWGHSVYWDSAIRLFPFSLPLPFQILWSANILLNVEVAVSQLSTCR